MLVIRAVIRCSVPFPFLFTSKRHKEKHFFYVCYLPAIATVETNFKIIMERTERKKCNRNNILLKSISSDCTDYAHLFESVRFHFSSYIFLSLFLLHICSHFNLFKVWETYIPIVALTSTATAASTQINLMGYFTFKSDSCRFPLAA